MFIRNNKGIILLVVATTLYLLSCAKQGSLSGGPKDLDAPAIDFEKSDSNFQTNYYPQVVNLYFDEWINLKNSSQILISPPLEFNPKIQSKGKGVEVIFDEREVLRDSTTYAINFGNSIVDFTESNPVPNYQFVFSTGDKIDSLILKGRVIDAFTKEAVEGVAVMLYDEYRDSIVYQEKPYYFSKTEKNGSFIIRNLRSGKFKCFALKDANFDFLFNQEQEQIGFVDSLVEIKADSFNTELVIEMFLPLPEQRIIESSIPNRGKLKLKTNRFIESFSIESINLPLYKQEIMDDSLLIWYQADTSSTDSLNLIYTLDNVQDTLIIKSKKSAKAAFPMNFSTFKQRKKTILAGDTLSILLNQILSSLDSNFIDLNIWQKMEVRDSLDSLKYIDTLVSLDYTYGIDSMDHRNMLLYSKWEEGKKYQLDLYPGGMNGYFENTNDTLQSDIQIEKLENLGNIYCQFDSLNADNQYVVLLKQKDKVIRKDRIRDSESYLLEYKKVLAGNYHLEIIQDENKNGRWDPGDYLNKKQSERKLEVKLEELRKNWDIETEIKWDSQ